MSDLEQAFSEAADHQMLITLIRKRYGVQVTAEYARDLLAFVERLDREMRELREEIAYLRGKTWP